jgi:NAD(P)-dependent dehydrogenase (short-subunit alcohol dehydrogenase family)
LLHARGAHPVLVARRVDRLEAIRAELGGALAAPCDVTRSEQVHDLVATVHDRYGRIDGLVNNAGVSLHQTLDGLSEKLFRDALEVNVVGALAMMQAVLPEMRAQGFGRIVNVGSGTTRMTPRGIGPYAATKAALNMLSAVARVEFAASGVIVSLVSPSVTASAFGGGRYRLGQEVSPGLIPHRPEYVARFIVRALESGDECLTFPTVRNRTIRI